MSRAAVLLACSLFFNCAYAAPLETGSPLPELVLEDQHGQRFELERDTPCLLFAADKAGSDIIGEAFEGFSKERFDALHVRYVADISVMPSLITKMFALPSLRARPYAVGLVEDAAVTADLPREAGAVTIMRFADGRLVSVDFVRNAAELRKALGVEQGG